MSFQRSEFPLLVADLRLDAPSLRLILIRCHPSSFTAKPGGRTTSRVRASLIGPSYPAARKRSSDVTYQEVARLQKKQKKTRKKKTGEGQSLFSLVNPHLILLNGVTVSLENRKHTSTSPRLKSTATTVRLGPQMVHGKGGVH